MTAANLVVTVKEGYNDMSKADTELWIMQELANTEPGNAKVRLTELRELVCHQVIWPAFA